MSETVMEDRPANPEAEEWAERIAAQQRSGMTVKQFCKERGLTEYSFYAWRKRLRRKEDRFGSLWRKGAYGGSNTRQRRCWNWR